MSVGLGLGLDPLDVGAVVDVGVELPVHPASVAAQSIAAATVRARNMLEVKHDGYFP